MSDWNEWLWLRRDPEQPGTYAKVEHSDRAEIRVPAAGERPLIGVLIEADGLEIPARFTREQVPLFPVKRLVLKGLFKPQGTNEVPWVGSKDGGIELAYALPKGLTLVPPAADIREVVRCADLTGNVEDFDSAGSLGANVEAGLALVSANVPLSLTPLGEKVAELTTKDVVARIDESEGHTKIAWFVDEGGIVFGWVPSASVRPTKEAVNGMGLRGGSLGGSATRGSSSRDPLICTHPVKLKVSFEGEVFEVGTVRAGKAMDVYEDGTAAPRAEEPGIRLNVGASWVIEASEIADCKKRTTSRY